MHWVKEIKDDMYNVEQGRDSRRYSISTLLADLCSGAKPNSQYAWQHACSKSHEIKDKLIVEQ